MSEEPTAPAASAGPSVRTRTERLCGCRRQRTVVGGLVLTGLLGIVLLSVWFPTVALSEQEPSHLAVRADTVVDIGIMAVLASIAAGFLYAVWNGGPLLSFALPVVPDMGGTVAAGGRTVDQDFVLLLTAGAATAALAVYTAGYWETGALSPNPYTGILDALTFSTALLALSGGVLLDFRAVAGPHVTGVVQLGVVLWGSAAVILFTEWVVCYRSTAGTSTGR